MATRPNFIKVAIDGDAITLRGVEAFSEALARARSGLGDLRTPVLVLHGADDPIAEPAHSQALAREGIEVRVLPGKKHDLLHERGAAQVMQDVRAWIDARVPRS